MHHLWRCALVDARYMDSSQRGIIRTMQARRSDATRVEPSGLRNGAPGLPARGGEIEVREVFA